MVAVTNIIPPHRSSFRPSVAAEGATSSPVETRPVLGRLSLVVAVVLLVAGLAYLVTAQPLAAPGTIGAEPEAYVVAEGDTMWTIARQLAPAGEAGQFLEHLVALNGSSTVSVGQALHVPAR